MLVSFGYQASLQAAREIQRQEEEEELRRRAKEERQRGQEVKNMAAQQAPGRRTQLRVLSYNVDMDTRQIRARTEKICDIIVQGMYWRVLVSGCLYWLLDWTHAFLARTDSSFCPPRAGSSPSCRRGGRRRVSAGIPPCRHE